MFSRVALVTFDPQERAEMDEALRLYNEGYKRGEILRMLKKQESWLQIALSGHLGNEAIRLNRHKRAVANGTKQLANPWLDPMDEANVEGYKVPTPEDIAKLAAEIRTANEQNGNLREARTDTRTLQLKCCPKCRTLKIKKDFCGRWCAMCHKRFRKARRDVGQEGQS